MIFWVFSTGLRPKFVKKYANLKEQAIKAVKEYKQDVEGGTFPSEEHSFK